MTSSLRSRSRASTISVLASMLRQGSMTPFGRPVEPDVKMIVIRSSSGMASMPRTRSSRGNGQERQQRGHSFVDRRGSLCQVFEEDHLDPAEIDRHAFEERAGGDHMAQTGLLHRETDELFGEAVVQIDGHAPVERERQVRYRRGDGRREKDPDVALVGRDSAPQQPSQHQRAQQRLASGQGRSRGVGERRHACSLAELGDDVPQQRGRFLSRHGSVPLWRRARGRAASLPTRRRTRGDYPLSRLLARAARPWRRPIPSRTAGAERIGVARRGPPAHLAGCRINGVETVRVPAGAGSGSAHRDAEEHGVANDDRRGHRSGANDLPCVRGIRSRGTPSAPGQWRGHRRARWACRFRSRLAARPTRRRIRGRWRRRFRRGLRALAADRPASARRRWRHRARIRRIARR